MSSPEKSPRPESEMGTFSNIGSDLGYEAPTTDQFIRILMGKFFAFEEEFHDLKDAVSQMQRDLIEIQKNQPPSESEKLEVKQNIDKLQKDVTDLQAKIGNYSFQQILNKCDTTARLTDYRKQEIELLSKKVDSIVSGPSTHAVVRSMVDKSQLERQNLMNNFNREIDKRINELKQELKKNP